MAGSSQSSSLVGLVKLASLNSHLKFSDNTLIATFDKVELRRGAWHQCYLLTTTS